MAEGDAPCALLISISSSERDQEKEKKEKKVREGGMEEREKKC